MHKKCFFGYFETKKYSCEIIKCVLALEKSAQMGHNVEKCIVVSHLTRLSNAHTQKTPAMKPVDNKVEY